MYKKIICMIMTLFSIFLFCGCSEIEYSQVIYPNGSIGEYVGVSVDKQALIAKGVDYEFVLNCIKEEIDTQLSRDMYKIFGVNVSSSINYNSGNVTAEILYANYDIYCRVFGIDPSEQTENEVIKGFLLDKEILTKHKLIYNTDNTKIITNNLNERLKEKYPQGVPFTINNCDCYYSYAIPLSQAQVERIKTNCTYSYDKTYTNETSSYSLRHFVWKCNPQNENYEMIIYQNHINLYAWYILAFILTFIFILIMIIVHYIKKRKNKINSNATIIEVADSDIKLLDANNKNDNDISKLLDI